MRRKVKPETKAQERKRQRVTQATQRAHEASALLDWLERESGEVKVYYNGWHVRVGNAHGEHKTSLRKAIIACRESLLASLREARRS